MTGHEVFLTRGAEQDLREYRQLMLGVYRVIYRRLDDRVFVYVIADGRRDMQSLLERHLLRS